MNVKSIIIVENGIVSGVYSTLPSGNHDIEVLDMDAAGHESLDEKDALETQIKEIKESGEYHDIY